MRLDSLKDLNFNSLHEKLEEVEKSENDWLSPDQVAILLLVKEVVKLQDNCDYLLDRLNKGGY